MKAEIESNARLSNRVCVWWKNIIDSATRAYYLGIIVEAANCQYEHGSSEAAAELSFLAELISCQGIVNGTD